MELSLAPLQGMTIAFYRNLYDHHFGGFDSYYTPFITTTDHHKKSLKLFKDLEPEYNKKKLTIIPQLLGNDGDQFLDFASSIVDMGYDEINWNIGCPYPMVTKKIKGSGILPYPDKVKGFLDKVCADDSFALTVKMRLGLLDPDEGMELIPIFNDYPIKKIIIHGRIASQKYSGNIDHDSFKALYQESRHKIVYNGDIFSVKDFTRIQQLYPDITEFMIGRGALIDPFLPLEIRGQHLFRRKERKVDCFPRGSIRPL